MSTQRMHTRLPLAVLAATVALLAAAGGAQAAVAPIKEIFSSHLGYEVNETGAKKCLVSEKCQPGKPSSSPGGFHFPEGIAGTTSGNVYVTDRGNHRVQELGANGEFILMFGAGVNRKGGNICTKAEESECQAGTEGTGAEQLTQPSSIAIDPATGDVYVLDPANERVERFSGGGEFLGSVTSGAEHGGAINNEALHGNLLAIGGPEDLLYVGERGRVQEFETDGKWKGEVTGLGEVQALAVDDSCALHVPVLTESTTPTCKSLDPDFGDIYIAEEGSDAIKQLSPAGVLVGEPISVSPTHPEEGGRVTLSTIAIDSDGRLAISAREESPEGYRRFGLLYEAGTGGLISEFQIPAEYAHGVGFNGSGSLYVVYTANPAHEVLAYTPVPIAELTTSSSSCVAGPEQSAEAAATFDCTLMGDVNPFGVASTEVWFEWGQTCGALGASTAGQSLPAEEAVLPVRAQIEGLRPNQSFCDRLAANDANVSPPEQMTGHTILFGTPKVAPRVVGEPSAEFVRSSSVDLHGELNPENAPTGYFFEYGTTLAGYCEGALRTSELQSELYARIGATLEASGLQPATRYQYRLCATDAAGDGGGATVGEFTTAPAPVPRAVTASASDVGVTGAVASGTVNPDGQAATYTFELGVYAGGETRYGVVFSGSAGVGTIPVEEALALSGLQPGTTYAYRIAVASGAGGQTGEAVLFTTQGLPAALTAPAVPALLAIPPIAFPTTTLTPTTKATAKKQAKKKRKKTKDEKKAKAKKTSRSREAK